MLMYVIKSMTIHVTESQIARYRNKEISFDGLARELGVWRPKLTEYFRVNGIKTNRDLKKDSIYHTVFSDITTEFQAYLLGLYVADGSIGTHTTGNHTAKRMSLGLTSGDFELLLRIRERLCPEHSTHTQPSKINSNGTVSKPMTRLTVTSATIYDDLVTLGYGPRKTYTSLNLPMLPDNLMWHFIRGYFDGDGTVGVYQGNRSTGASYTNYKFSLIAKTSSLLLEIQQFFTKYSISATVTKDIKRDVWYLYVSRKTDIGLLKRLLYDRATIFLTRKHSKFMAIPS